MFADLLLQDKCQEHSLRALAFKFVGYLVDISLASNVSLPFFLTGIYCWFIEVFCRKLDERYHKWQEESQHNLESQNFHKL